MRLLGSARAELASVERPSSEEKRVDGYPITALSATKTALTVAIVSEEPSEVIRDPRLGA